MSYKVFELDFRGSVGYTFLIGVRDKPTNRERERIGRALEGVWSELFDREYIGKMYSAYKNEPPPSYGFELVPDSSISPGETTLPGFRRGGFYLLFVLAESETAVSEEDEEETKQGIMRAISATLERAEPKPRIGVIVLYNSSVQMLQSETRKSWVVW